MAESGNVPELAEASEQGGGVSLLTLGALGVVFGDIGTSPLYAFKAAFGETLFKGSHQIARAEEISHVMGTLSLFLWSILIVICLKYVVLMMRADNDGEGGVLAMFSLLLSKRSKDSGLQQTFSGIASKGPLALVAIVGAALLYGDGVITPAISVLAAAEGINFAAGGTLPEWVSPAVAVVVLAVLFTLQKFGTGQIGRLFGPVMLVWFFVIGAWIGWDHRQSGCASGRESHVGHRPLSRLAVAGVRAARCGGAVRDRLRSPEPRHGALWATGNTNRLVLRRLPGLAPELLRAGR